MASRYCYAKRFPKNGKQKIKTAPKQKQKYSQRAKQYFPYIHYSYAMDKMALKLKSKRDREQDIVFIA